MEQGQEQEQKRTVTGTIIFINNQPNNRPANQTTNQQQSTQININNRKHYTLPETNIAPETLLLER